MKTLLLLSFALISSNSFAQLSNKLVVETVLNSKLNQIAANVPKQSSCKVFKGTYHGNSVILRPTAKGGSGNYRHRLVWQISESYKTFELERTQSDIVIRDGRTFMLNIPELKEDVSFLQQPVFLITEDASSGETVTSQILFNVTRPVVLSETNDPKKLEKNCFQIFPAVESVAGILTNGSTNPSQILIRQGVQSLWTKTSGSQFGFYISPLAWSGMGNVFSIYKNYFSQFSRQTIETVEVSNGYQIAPGDFIQLYEQRTRYITTFDAFEVSACGETKEVPGAYYMQWWGVAYHAIPVNPYSSERPPRETIGVSPINHCPDELTPEFARDNGDFIFSRTN
ncbi:MAG: hypothetical protein AB7I27_06025 [Bacteriovoracaceae bacterium]